MLGMTEAQGSYEQIRDRAFEIIDAVKALGVRVPPHGRLCRYAKQLKEFCRAGTGAKGKVDLEQVHRALLEIADMSLIIEHLTRDSVTPGLLRVMTPAMSGGSTLGEEKRQSSARDFQFEMLVAALFKRAGYDVCFEEPDVVVATPLGPVGIAAKRPRSRGNLRRLIEDADDQIRRSGHDGIIAIDISYLLMPSDLHIPANDGGAAVIKAAIDAFAADTWKDARAFVNPRRTIGYIAYGALVAARHGISKRSLRGCLFTFIPFIGNAQATKPQLSVARGCSFGNFIPFADNRMTILREFRERVTCAV